MDIVEKVSLILGIIPIIVAIIQTVVWLRQIWKEKDKLHKFWLKIKENRIFLVILVVVLVTSFVIFGAAKAYEYCKNGPCPVECVLSYADFRLEDVTVDKEQDKAIIYGAISKSVCVPRGKTHLIVEITIPSNGWGEGLAGPDDSSVEIRVDSQVTYERITADPEHYHHGWYYKYEYGDHFSNTFDVAGKDNIVLTIRMIDGAHMDFKQATLTFE
jgi:hypothetical protein